MEKLQHVHACVPHAQSSIQYKTAQTSVGSHFCVQCCSSSDRYVVCRLTRESMWSVQEIVKTPKREHRARPYRILLISLQTSPQTSSQNSSWSSFYSPCSPMAMSHTAVSPGGFGSPGMSFNMLPQPTMTQHEAWPYQYPWMPSRPYYGSFPTPSMPALAQSPLSDSRFTKLSSTEKLDDKLPSGICMVELCALFLEFSQSLGHTTCFHERA